MDNKIFYNADAVPLIKKIWFFLTCWRPVTKYEMYSLKGQLITILEGIRESDMQHYATERAIIEEMKKIVEKKNNKDDKTIDGMFN
jgi:hypothetical protein